MGFTYLELVNRVLSLGDQPAVTALSADSSEWAYKAQNAVNDSLKELSLRLKIKTRQVEFQFSTVAEQSYYCITKRVIYPFVSLRMSDVSGLLNNLNPVDSEFINSSTITVQDNTYFYHLAGYSSVLGQPLPTGEYIYISSSNTADISKVCIQGWDAYDNYMSEEITLSGTTQVQSSYQFAYIDSISKGVTEGTITIETTGDSAFTLLQMARKETHTRYPVIRIYPTPTSVKTVYGKSYLIIPDLVNEKDVPLGLSELATNAIIANAHARFMEYNPKLTTWSRDALWALAEKEIRNLIKNDNQDNIMHRMRLPNFPFNTTPYVYPLERSR